MALVELEGGTGAPVSEKVERVALPYVVLPAVVFQLDVAEPRCEAAQSTACIDRRQLGGVAGQDELPASMLDSTQQLVEHAGADHAGLVDDEHRARSSPRLVSSAAMLVDGIPASRPS